MISNQPLTLREYHQLLLTWKTKYPRFFSNQPTSADQLAFAKMLRLVILTALLRINPNNNTDVGNFLLFATNVQWLIRIDVLMQSGQDNQLIAVKKWIELINPEIELNHYALPEIIIQAIQHADIAPLISALPSQYQKNVSLNWLQEIQTRASERIDHAEALIPHLNTVTTLFAARGARALTILQGYLLDTKTFLQQFDDIIARIKMAVELKASQVQLIKALQEQMLPPVLKMEDDGLEIKGFHLTELKRLLTQPLATIPEFNAFRDYAKYNQTFLEEKIRLANESLERINRKYQDALKALPTNIDVKMYFEENFATYSSLLKKPAPHLESQLRVANKLICLTLGNAVQQFASDMQDYAHKYRTYDIESQTVGAARKRLANTIEPLASALSKQLEPDQFKYIILTKDLSALHQIELLMRKLVRLLDTAARDPAAGKRLTAIELKQLAGKIGVSSDTTLMAKFQHIKPVLISLIESLNQVVPELKQLSTLQQKPTVYSMH